MRPFDHPCHPYFCFLRIIGSAHREAHLPHAKKYRDRIEVGDQYGVDKHSTSFRNEPTSARNGSVYLEQRSVLQ